MIAHAYFGFTTSCGLPGSWSKHQRWALSLREQKPFRLCLPPLVARQVEEPMRVLQKCTLTLPAKPRHTPMTTCTQQDFGEEGAEEETACFARELVDNLVTTYANSDPPEDSPDALWQEGMQDESDEDDHMHDVMDVGLGMGDADRAESRIFRSNTRASCRAQGPDRRHSSIAGSETV